ncbi:hypothetical protein P8452_46566 [Trifolium repens]|nr:hypothetical protein P8452_46564 [Trifolium repens]WJX61476.1 hypothetical protein P8452_46566 [Trifolium repens]
MCNPFSVCSFNPSKQRVQLMYTSTVSILVKALCHFKDDYGVLHYLKGTLLKLTPTSTNGQNILRLIVISHAA